MEVFEMNILAINGSPRKNKNTATLLNYALEGAKSCGNQTKLINLYELNYKGCLSCFACKLKGGKNYGKCAVKDDLTPVLETAIKADAIIIGSPIYFHSITSSTRAFLERLLFPYLSYDKNHSSISPKKIPIGLIYTMNVDSQQYQALYKAGLKSNSDFLIRIFGSCETLIVNDTYQFDDYSKYFAPLFDVKKKEITREFQFPKDCHNAFIMGQNIINKV